MQSYLPRLTPQNEIKPVFNPVDFEWIYGYATYADLLRYANIYSSNVFYSPNSFTTIYFNENINGISPEVFDYLKNVNMDIQQQFSNDRTRLSALETKTTNQSFNSGNNRTIFSGTLTAPTFLLNNVNLNTRISAIETNVSSLNTKTTAQSYNSTNTTTNFSGSLSASTIILNGTNLNTRLTTNETNTTNNTTEINSLKTRMTSTESNVLTNTNDITNIKPRLSTVENTLTTLETTIINNIENDLNTRAYDNTVVHISGDEIINGVKTFIQTPYIGLFQTATKNDITIAINQLIGSAGSAYDTLGEIQTILQNNGSSIETILSSMVNISGIQTITGAKTFTSLINGSSLNISGNSTLGTNNSNSLLVKSTSTFQSPIIFTTTLNNINTTTFSFLSGVSSNIQTQFNNITTRLTNYIYYSDTNTQKITSKTAIEDTLTTNVITNNNIINDTITSNSIFVDKIVCNKIRCINLSDSLPIPLVYITNQGIQYPIMKSDSFSNLTGINFTQPLYITIAPNYQFVLYDENNLALGRVFNNTNNYVYNIGIQFSTSIPKTFILSVL